MKRKSTFVCLFHYIDIFVSTLTNHGKKCTCVIHLISIIYFMFTDSWTALFAMCPLGNGSGCPLFCKATCEAVNCMCHLTIVSETRLSLFSINTEYKCSVVPLLIYRVNFNGCRTFGLKNYFQLVIMRKNKR